MTLRSKPKNREIAGDKYKHTETAWDSWPQTKLTTGQISNSSAKTVNIEDWMSAVVESCVLDLTLAEAEVGALSTKNQEDESSAL